MAMDLSTLIGAAVVAAAVSGSFELLNRWRERLLRARENQVRRMEIAATLVELSYMQRRIFADKGVSIVIEGPRDLFIRYMQLLDKADARDWSDYRKPADQGGSPEKDDEDEPPQGR